MCLGSTKAAGLLFISSSRIRRRPVPAQGRPGTGGGRRESLPTALLPGALLPTAPHTAPPHTEHCPANPAHSQGKGAVGRLSTAAGLRAVGSPLLMDQLGWKRGAAPVICCSSAVDK